MKYLILSIVGALLIIVIVAQQKTINEVKHENKILDRNYDVIIKERLQVLEVAITDSLDSIYKSKPPITEIKTQIKYKYDTITDTILIRPTSEQLEYITRELDRLYPD